MTYIYASARIDIDEILSAIDTDDLVEELKGRRYDEVDKNLVEAIAVEFEPHIFEAYECIRAGRVDDAMLILERTLWPKWKTKDALALSLKARAA